MNTCPSQTTALPGSTATLSDNPDLDSPDSRIRHPRMPVADRAKIFAPFAALTGFEKVIEAENAKASTP